MADRRTRTAAVIGAGLLGVDLVERLTTSATLSCGLLVGRNSSLTGLRRAGELGVATSTGGIDAIISRGDIDVVFDASDADAHPEHWAALRTSDVLLVNLTPSGGGRMVVPTVNGHQARADRHLNLITCGGQTALPILDVITQHCSPDYVEIVTTAASASVGRAARRNLDQYIETTSFAAGKLAPEAEIKILTSISPALPAPAFRVHLSVLARDIRASTLRADLDAVVAAVRAFAPGYQISSLALDGGRITVTVTITAHWPRLPTFAGNVEIINAAAVVLAEQHVSQLNLEPVRNA